MKLPSGSFTSHGYRRKPFFCQPVFHMIFPHGHRWSIRKQSPVEVFHGWPHEQLISNGLELRYSKNQSKANKKLYYCSNKQFMLPTRTAYVSSKIAIGVLWPSPFLAEKDRTKNLTMQSHGPLHSMSFPKWSHWRNLFFHARGILWRLNFKGRIAGMIFKDLSEAIGWVPGWWI